MKTLRFSDSQIIAILKLAEGGSPVPELCWEHGISSAAFYKWCSKFGGMDASLMARLKELEDENWRLKKMYAEERLKAAILKEALQKSGEAILPTRDGAANRRERRQHQAGLLSVFNQPDLQRYHAKQSAENVEVATSWSAWPTTSATGDSGCAVCTCVTWKTSKPSGWALTRLRDFVSGMEQMQKFMMSN